MISDFENVFRQMLKSVVREVFDEVLRERHFEPHQTTTSIKPVQDEERFLLRAREAAKRLAISQRHLQRLTAEGVLPCVRVGNLRHYSVKTIEGWIRESESTDAPEPRKRLQQVHRRPRRPSCHPIPSLKRSSRRIGS